LNKRGRRGGTVSRMIWKILACLDRTHSIRTHEGKSKEKMANSGLHVKKLAAEIM